MTKWREVRLGDVAYINNKNLSNKFNGLIKYLDISSVSKGTLKSYKTYNFKDAPSRARRKVEANDIIYSTVRPNLRSYYIFADKIDNNLVVSTGFVVLSVHKNYSEKYIYYYLTTESIVSYFTLIARGTSYPALGVNDFKDLKIKVPDLKTQEKIAKVLSTYDELIENNNRRIELLEQMAEEIYKEWFVRMRFPGYEETKFQKGIPEGWEIDYFINDNVKLISSGIDKFDGNKIYLATADVDGIGIVGGEEITHTDRPSRANMQPKKGSIWFAKMQDTVKHLYFDNFSEDRISKLILSTGFAGIKFKNMNYFYYYLSFIRHGVFENIKDMYANGSTQVAINNKNIKRLKLIIPSEDLLLNFNNKLENIYFIIQKYKEQNQNLIKQRDMLLPRLMNGTIEVE